MTRVSMTSMVEEYLEHRRSLGFKLKVEGQQLLNFGAYADRIGHQGPLTLDLAIRWVRSRDGASDLYLARRLEVVRCFARYRAVHDPETEVPAKGLLGRAHRRTTPYVYAESELAQLVAGTSSLQPADSIRPMTYATLLGLLSCTGLRISEALRLKRTEVDLQNGVLRILMTKFRKSRMVPLHASAVNALAKYADVRDAMFSKRSAEVFFVGRDGAALPYTTVRSTFRWLCRRLGMDTPAGRRRPRIHDMRHSFACRRLQLWYEQGIDVGHSIASLSTYMGHGKVTDTYWYLTGIPELMSVAARRFERFAARPRREPQ